MLYLVAVKVTLTVAAASAPGFRSATQAAVFGWPWLAAWAAAGAVGIWLTHAVGLPGVWSPSVPLKLRLGYPLLAGLAMGGFEVAVDRLTHFSALSARAMGLPTIHIAWPQSLLIYPGGAIIVDIIYYLLPIPLLTWLVTRVVKDPARFSMVFWIVGFLAALVEPVTQSGGNGLAGSGMVVAAFFASDLVANLAQVWAMRRAGFGAAVVFRVAFYLVWHVLNGLTGA